MISSPNLTPSWFALALIMTSNSEETYRLYKDRTHWTVTFQAMASPCEIFIQCNNESEANQLASLAFGQTRRIETTYSRYRDDNIIHKINNSDGKAIEVDSELARMLDYAAQCHELSDGLFDITSGILRKAWRFDGKDYHPDKKLIKSLLDRVGWDKVEWDGKKIKMLPGMQIDLGGIGKEYAVDRVAELLFEKSGSTLMVNYGGDIRGMTKDNEPEPWIIGIEDPNKSRTAVGEIRLTNGGVATSGDLHRYCMVKGKRLGHILNPKTGWPAKDAPRSVTVMGNYCVEAGFLSTLAILQGENAKPFLDSLEIPAHCVM